MSLAGGMSMFGGSAFLNAMGSQHGTTQANRLMRPYQNFETPWGKGPYWSEELMNRQIQGRVADAKAAGLHPLFAMGYTGAGGSGGNVTPQRPQAGPGAPSVSSRGKQSPLQRQMDELTIRRQRVALEKDQVELMAARSAEARIEQAANYKRSAPLPDEYKTPAALPPAETMTKKNILRGAFGGAYEMPEGITPQREWEDRIGEAADWTAGPAIALRIIQKREKRMRGMRHQIRAARRAKARKQYPRWEKLKRGIKSGRVIEDWME